MNGGSFSLLRVTPKTTVSRSAVPEVFILIVLATHFSKDNDPYVCLININNEPRSYRRSESVDWCLYVPNASTLTWSSFMFWETCVTLQRTIPSFTIHHLNPIDRAARDTFSFPANLLSSIESIQIVQHQSCYIKPSKVACNMLNSLTLFLTLPW